MLTLGLIKEEKIPTDNRVALTPSQCRWIHRKFAGVKIAAQSSPARCFSDEEYRRAGVAISDDLSGCDVLVGIKEIPVRSLVPGKTYFFFSHTKKKQPHNQKLLQVILEKKITLVDFECLEHDDGQRILGFGFFAGIVGAHNGMMAYGSRTGAYKLDRVFQHKTLRSLMHTYFHLALPTVKIVVTGSGRVSQGIAEIMNLMQIRPVEKEEFLAREFAYPVYVHLKGSDLYAHESDGTYNRNHFHRQPHQYRCLFLPYAQAADVLLNGVYWDAGIPRLFQKEDVQHPAFRLQVIADVTDDANGSVPINLGDQPADDPVYGVDKQTFEKTAPYLPTSVDVMAVGNLPNELPRDASRYFGEQFIKFILPELIQETSVVLNKATIVRNGELTPAYEYLRNYAAGREAVS